MDWLANIYGWVVENKDAILTVLTSAETIGIVASIITLFKQKKNINDNTASTTELQTSLLQTKTLNSELKEEVVKLRAEKEAEKGEKEKEKEKLDATLVKVDAMVKALKLVYNYSIKDSETRTAVSNLLTNAEYNDSSVKASIIDELNSIKENLKTVQENTEKSIESVYEKVANEKTKTVKKETTKAVIRG